MRVIGELRKLNAAARRKIGGIRAREREDETETEGGEEERKRVRDREKEAEREREKSRDGERTKQRWREKEGERAQQSGVEGPTSSLDVVSSLSLLVAQDLPRLVDLDEPLQALLHFPRCGIGALFVWVILPIKTQHREGWVQQQQLLTISTGNQTPEGKSVCMCACVLVEGAMVQKHNKTKIGLKNDDVEA